tara:strand:+ start:614 stop:2455 length:1842 start_codon:yes stop_codon:yes gene_type:complete
MAVKRYYADADTTITNAYKQNLSTRGTGSNMGAADSLETFFIYGHAHTSSAEVSKILVKFPMENITADRSATPSRIPAKDSVKFYLRMFNAEHALPLPKKFTLSVRPVTTAWQEGTGLDMDEYKDGTYDLYEGANWEVAMSGSDAKAVAKITALSKTAGQANTRVLNITDAGNQTVNFQIDNSISTSTATKIAFGNANSDATQFAANIVVAVNLANTANTCNVTATSSGAVVTLAQDTAGLAGETTIDGTAVSDSVVTVTESFSTVVSWTTEGGDYVTDSHARSQTTTFAEGTEDLEVDITNLVEDWLDSTLNNYGVGIHMTGSYELTKKSYYTKKFFARSSEYFFKRPVIEARWDSTEKDERGNFYAKSNLLSTANNTNTIYFKNYFNGVLTDISGDPSLRVNVYSDSEKSYQITNEAGVTYHAATAASPGVYSDDVIVDTSLSEVYVEWVDSTPTVYYKETIAVKQREVQTVYKPTDYVFAITNLKTIYSVRDNARIRLFARQKDWNPSIYTVASKTPENLIIEDVYYKIYRIADELEVISYGTGSVTNAVPESVPTATSHTRLSYDISGSYFDLDMSLFETDYSYGIKFVHYHDGYYREQPEIFKFRVEK